MIGTDRLLSNRCPECGTFMTVEPKTIIGGRADGYGFAPSGPKMRWVYLNFCCDKCGLKFAKLTKELEPVGNS